MKKSTSWTVLFYGLAIAALGYLGYHQSQSKASLWSGLGSGSLLILSSLAMFFHRKGGVYAALTVTLLLTIIFCYRYTLTHGALPAVLSIISGGMLIYLLVQIGKWRK